MKKHITILLFLVIQLQSWSQNFIKSTVPCNDALMQKIPGRWVNDKDNIYAPNLNKTQIQESLKRLDNIQQLVLTTYPTPIGVDASWMRTVNDDVFSTQFKFSKTTEGESKYNLANGIPVTSYFYSCSFYKYSCGRDQYEIRTGWPGETGTYLFVTANNLNSFFIRNQLEPELQEAMCIDERPIKLLPPVKGKWKGYTLYNPDGGGNLRYVLLHRDGILPYVPVSRKQYLDRCLNYISKFYDPKIKGLEAITDKEQREELAKNYNKQKDDQLKKYSDELETTTAAKLLDSPAIIPQDLFNVGSEPVFVNEESGGKMLVTENPAYFRKDLGKHIPQFMVLRWAWDDWKPQEDVSKIIYENFPIEKLQEMIDK